MNKQKEAAWAEAKKRHRLSNETVRMARELGLNPKKLGKIDNHKQESWKAPLAIFIQDLYDDLQAKRLKKQKQKEKQARMQAMPVTTSLEAHEGYAVTLAYPFSRENEFLKESCTTIVLELDRYNLAQTGPLPKRKILGLSQITHKSVIRMV